MNSRFKTPILMVAIWGLGISACTSTQELRAQPTCSVWKDQGSFGPFYVRVDQKNRVEEKTKCLFYVWFCTSFESEIKDNGEILAKQPGLFSEFRKVAVLNSSAGGSSRSAEVKTAAVSYEPSLFESIMKSSPIQIDMENHTAKRTVELTAFAATRNEQELEFSPSCTKSQAAVGAVAVWLLENSNH